VVAGFYDGWYLWHVEDIITIDGAGRLVIPKAMRTRLQLVPGRRLRVIEDGGRLVLEPAEDVSKPVEVNGLLVIRGKLRGPVPDHRALREMHLRDRGARRA
jgi:AbrB family looped-hinge helix DNA binding protein